MTIHAPLPPEHPAIELSLIGAALLSPSVIERLVMDVDLEPADFSWLPMGKAWAAILELHAQDGRVTPATLEAKLDQVPLGAHTSAQLVADAVASPSDIAAIIPHGRLVKQAALQRTWAQAGYKLLEAAGVGDEQLVANAEQLLAAPTVSEDTHSPEAFGLETLRFLNEKGAVGTETGFAWLDNMLAGGLRPGDSTALGAWTSMGKSALVDQILTHAARLGARCHAYVNEMSAADRGIRCIARETNIPYSRLVIRDLRPDEHSEAIRAAGRMPFGITDCAQWSADRISRHIRANKWDLCTLDLLHNMDYRDTADLDRIIAKLGAAARTSGSHLILICQFNEARAVGEILPRPVMRDLRGSGMIKNVCANVLLLHREQTNEDGIVFTQDNGWLIIDKARHGRRGVTMSVEFNPQQMTFYELSPVRAAA